MKSVRMNVIGRVQGVGFRYLTKMEADQLGVVGRVWNEADGSVSIEAQGEAAVMEKFITIIKNSPSPAGKVSQFTIEDIPPFEATNFQVTYA